MQEEYYDLVVIGAGPAGYAGAIRAADFGKSVCLIEKKKLGGAAVHHGVLTSKTLWELALRLEEMSENSKNFETGIRCQVDMPWINIRQRIQQILAKRQRQFEHNLEKIIENYKNKFVLEHYEAEICTPHRIALKKDGEIVKYIGAENILIATGSKPRNMANIAVDGKSILTSDHIETLENYPESIVIVGAGVIGCEFATIFSSLGQTKVYLIDRAERILPFEDEDVSSLVAKNLEAQGVTIHHNAQLVRLITKENGRIEYEIAIENQPNQIIEVEKALLSIGREPITSGLGLEKVGVKIDPKTQCIQDNDTQTSIPNIYAAGDVSGKIALVSVGEIEARHAVERMFGNSQKPLSYDNICSIMFLNPEVAAVGMNEQQCQRQGLPIKVVKIDYSLIPRALAMGKTNGFFKIIVTHDNSMRILGMRAIGEHASTAIQAIGLLIKTNKSIQELAELIHPHPSIIEGIQECVRILLNKSIFKTYSYPEKLACYSNVNGVKKDLNSLLDE